MQSTGYGFQTKFWHPNKQPKMEFNWCCLRLSLAEWLVGCFTLGRFACWISGFCFDDFSLSKHLLELNQLTFSSWWSRRCVSRISWAFSHTHSICNFDRNDALAVWCLSSAVSFPLCYMPPTTPGWWLKYSIAEIYDNFPFEPKFVAFIQR